MLRGLSNLAGPLFTDYKYPFTSMYPRRSMLLIYVTTKIHYSIIPLVTLNCKRIVCLAVKNSKINKKPVNSLLTRWLTQAKQSNATWSSFWLDLILTNSHSRLGHVPRPVDSTLFGKKQTHMALPCWYLHTRK